MKRKLSIWHIAVACMILISVITYIVLTMTLGGKHSKIVGALSQTNATVSINGQKIPSYGYDGRVYIAAEDLQPFGITLDNTLSGLVIEFNEDNLAPSKEYTFSNIAPGSDLAASSGDVIINDYPYELYIADEYNIIPAESIKSLDAFSLKYSDVKYEYTVYSKNSSSNIISGSKNAEKQKPEAKSASASPIPTVQSTSGVSAKKIIVLDPGHGKSSSDMSAEEKEQYGWTYNSSKNQWGEWRHWKSGTVWEDCCASGCSKKGDCWYPIYNSDRSIEPDINLQNCLAAKKYLEQMGYTVRLTRSGNDENPSITQRFTYCYPNQNTDTAPDAEAFICVHSNAGGGTGSSYIQLEPPYDQKGISSSYSENGNKLGKTINDEIINTTSLGSYNGGKIGNLSYLIAFCKSPVTCAYLEIGFFDNSKDLSILKSEADSIGKAIANGIDNYLNSL